MEKVTLKQVEHIAFTLARDFFTYNEPIPDFTTRYPNVLESCLAAPFQTFAKRELYLTFVTKISMLFYLMIKNHPFQNGNKRIAMTTLFYVLYREKKWLKVDAKTLYSFAVFVAGSVPSGKNQVVRYMEKFMTTYMVPLKAKKVV